MKGLKCYQGIDDNVRNCEIEDSFRGAEGIMRLGIDVGGTFTDLYAYDPGRNVAIVQKVPSTPSDFKEGVFNVIEKANIDLKHVEYFIHGSTICTNAIIQGTCPATPLITTEGFQDLMAIGRYHRMSLYDPYQQKPPPLVKRRHTFGVPERIASTGEIIKALDRGKAQEVSKMIRDLNVKSVCVSMSFISSSCCCSDTNCIWDIEFRFFRVVFNTRDKE